MRIPQSLPEPIIELASPESTRRILGELRLTTRNADLITASGNALFLATSKDSYLFIRLKLGAETKSVLAAIDAAIGHLESNGTERDTAQTVGATLAVLSYASCEIEVRLAHREMHRAVDRLTKAADAL